MADEELALDAERKEELEEPDPEEDLSSEQKALAKLKEAIVVQREEVGALRLKLTITVPRETLHERMDEQFAELRSDALIPGFRKGKAPIRLVEKRFATDVGDQLKSQLIGSGYMAAVEKEGLKPLGDPQFWVKIMEERVGEDGKPRSVETDKLVPVDQALETLELPVDAPLTFSCEVEIKPEFELPSLEKIPVRRPRITVRDEDIEEHLRRMRMSRGRFRPVEDGSAEPHDLLYADMKMSVDGEVLYESNFELSARDGYVKGVLLLGLGEKLVGRKTSDEVNIEAVIPNDHEQFEVRGKTARFEFTIREIKRLELPPIDEAFLTSMGFGTEQEMRETIRRRMDSRIDEEIRRGMREQVSAHLLENTQVTIPEGLSQRQVNRTIAKRMIDMYQANVPPPEIDKELNELRIQAPDQVARDLKLFFILEKIAEERNIEISEEQMNAAISAIARRTQKRFDRVRDELTKTDKMLSLYLHLRDEKMLDELVDGAEVTEMEGPDKETAAT